MPSQVSRHRCEIVEVERLGVTRRVILRPESPAVFDFLAGQYAQIELSGGRWCPFSIANPPHQIDHLELHIRISADSADSLEIERLIERRGPVVVELPFGDCVLDAPPDRATLFIAAGTGFAQMKSLIEQCFHWRCSMPLHLYWGAYHPHDLYLELLPRAWQKRHPLFRYQSVLFGPDPDWRGYRGLLHELIAEDFSSLEGMTVFLSGSPAMVYGTLDALLPLGLQPDQCRADAFSYAPRDRRPPATDNGGTSSESL